MMIGLLIVVGNSLVITSVFLVERQKRRKQDVVKVSLAVADMLAGRFQKYFPAVVLLLNNGEVILAAQSSAELIVGATYHNFPLVLQECMSSAPLCPTSS